MSEKFKIGDRVKWWSGCSGKWWFGTIRDIRDDKAVANIDTDNGWSMAIPKDRLCDPEFISDESEG